MTNEQDKLYLECYSGISGDMFVAALLDLGASENELRKALNSIPLECFKIEISRVFKSGLEACDFNVILDADCENHDHDMAYLYALDRDNAHDHDHEHSHEHEHEHSRDHEHCHAHEHEHSHDHDHCHAHEHEHGHEHEHSHDHVHCHEHEHVHCHEHEHEHGHRTLSEIFDILDRTELTESARSLAKRIFTVLGQAEAKAHGTTPERVHFHEVGAVDSIVDIIAAAVCLDNLGIKEVIVPVLYEGMGCIRCQHGILPVPVPAVSHIAAQYGLKLHITEAQGEYVTPTGAAIVAAICTQKTLPSSFVVRKIGLGAGKRNQGLSGILRALRIQTPNASYADQDTIYQLESNIDDCSGESMGHVMQRLIKAGARDVQYTPIYMKKNRPAYQLTVLCVPEDVSLMESIIFSETTSIGIRRVRMERTILRREIKMMQTSLGVVSVKVCTVPVSDINADRPITREVRGYPEYESVSEICLKTGRSYQDVYAQILKEINI